LKAELGEVKAELIDTQQASAAERVVSDVHLDELRGELANAKRLLQREKGKQQGSEGAMEALHPLHTTGTFLPLTHARPGRSKWASFRISGRRKPDSRSSSRV